MKKPTDNFFNYIVANGWNNIKHEVLFENLLEKQAREIEKEQIKKMWH